MCDSCLRGCKYCYANHSAVAVQKKFGIRDPTSPLLCYTIGPEDVVRVRTMESCKMQQMNILFV